MNYIGSKYSIWKYIKDIILDGYGESYNNYVEPFCGGCNSMMHVKTSFGCRRIASDINPYLIAMFKSLIKNESQFYPISRDLYYDAFMAYKNNDFTKFSLSDLGWIGFMAAYRGKFFGGYSGIVNSKRDGELDFVNISIKSVLKTLDGISDVEFYCCSYDKLNIPLNSIIYCDPPYKGTLGYGYTFNYDEFYDWCVNETKRGNKVFISEYEIEDERFKEIFSIENKCCLNKNQKLKDRIEKLYTVR